RMGSSPRNASSARYFAELVSSSTSQLCATFCIQVPMLDVHAPIQRMRKSRYDKAAASLAGRRAGTADAVVAGSAAALEGSGGGDAGSAAAGTVDEAWERVT